VTAGSGPAEVGDEAVLLARRCGCPVAAGPDRAAAAALLVGEGACDLVVSDDGLQHYALARDVEVAVVDGVRRFGNGRCLPAGPLREPASRLRGVDFVVARGPAGPGEFAMDYDSGPLLRVADDREGGAPAPGTPVHGVAGIGDPEPFFDRLRGLGYRVAGHPFPDHHPFTPGDLDFADDLPVIMTEKDAVKCRAFAGARCWYLPVAARVPAALAAAIIDKLEENRG
jgi:tetraacyldisaccharide 4'-kinase